MDEQQKPDAWVGERVDLGLFDGIGAPTDIEGANHYALGVRSIRGVLLVEVTDRGIVIESTGFDTDGMRFFRPWGSILMIALSK